MKKKKKYYYVTLDMSVSHDFRLKATSKTEAKKLAVEKVRKKLSVKMFNGSAEIDE